jgi:hypothetical protein
MSNERQGALCHSNPSREKLSFWVFMDFFCLFIVTLLKEEGFLQLIDCVYLFFKQVIIKLAKGTDQEKNEEYEIS